MAIEATGTPNGIWRRLAAAAAFGLSVLLLATGHARAQAEHPARDTFQGVVFHFGVVPAEVVLAHPAGHPERSMHGDAAKGQKHLVLALFDAATGQRIAQADVQATVAQAGGPAVTKTLQAMSIADQPSFGGFFHMTPGAYRIRFQVKRAGFPPAVAEFEYRVSG